MKQKSNKEADRERQRGRKRFLERIQETRLADKEIKHFRREYEEFPEREPSPKGE